MGKGQTSAEARGGKDAPSRGGGGSTQGNANSPNAGGGRTGSSSNSSFSGYSDVSRDSDRDIAGAGSRGGGGSAQGNANSPNAGGGYTGGNASSPSRGGAEAGAGRPSSSGDNRAAGGGVQGLGASERAGPGVGLGMAAMGSSRPSDFGDNRSSAGGNRSADMRGGRVTDTALRGDRVSTTALQGDRVGTRALQGDRVSTAALRGDRPGVAAPAAPSFASAARNMGAPAGKMTTDPVPSYNPNSMANTATRPAFDRFASTYLSSPRPAQDDPEIAAFDRAQASRARPADYMAQGDIAARQANETAARNRTDPSRGLPTSLASPRTDPAPVAFDPTAQAMPPEAYAPGGMAFSQTSPNQGRLGGLAGAASRSTASVRDPLASQVVPVGALPSGPDIQRAADTIARAEGTIGNAKSKGYDTVYGFGKYGSITPTKTTIAGIIGWQVSTARKFGLDAAPVGKYQAVASTLSAWAKKSGIDINTTLFDEKMQDRFLQDKMVDRVKQAGPNASVEDVAKALAKEWESLPAGPNGRSHRHGKQTSVSWDAALGVARDAMALANGSAPSGATAPNNISSFGPGPTGMVQAQRDAVGMPGLTRAEAAFANQIGAPIGLADTPRVGQVNQQQAAVSGAPQSAVGTPAGAPAGTTATSYAPTTSATTTAPATQASTPQALSSYAPAKVSFAKEWQAKGVVPGLVDFAGRLATASGLSNITVNSGHRPEAYNAKVGGAKGSKHIGGMAIDVSTAGWTDRQKRDFVANANRFGAGAVISYDKYSHIHVEMPGSRGVNQPTANMHNSSAKNLGAAPEWMKGGVADAAGSTAPAGGFPAQPNAPLGGLARGVALGIDAASAMVPGIGTFVGLANGALTLTGNQSLGTMMVESFLNGEGQGAGPRDENALGGEDLANVSTETEASTEEKPSAPTFESKYLRPEKKFPTPQEKWASRSFNPTAA